MKYSKLKVGEFYTHYFTYQGRPSSIIFLFSGDLKRKNHLINANGEYKCSGCCGTGTEFDFEPSTPEEIALLKSKMPENCIPNKINEAYEIF